MSKDKFEVDLYLDLADQLGQLTSLVLSRYPQYCERCNKAQKEEAQKYINQAYYYFTHHYRDLEKRENPQGNPW